jgi:nicotinamidase-related amidase
MEERHARILNRERAALLVVDVQERLWPVMRERQRLVDRIVIMIKACDLLKIPVFITEQYPKGLGVTISPIKETLRGKEPLVKMTFSCCGLTQLPKALEEKGIERVVVVGIESHVCVLQTALDLLARGFQVHIPRDAISSRYEEDERTALQRMAREGVVITTVEMVLFELLRTAEAPEFKQVSQLIK